MTKPRKKQRKRVLRTQEGFILRDGCPHREKGDKSSCGVLLAYRVKRTVSRGGRTWKSARIECAMGHIVPKRKGVEYADE